MANKRYFIWFLVLALAQLVVLTQMVWRWESVLQNGEKYYWETAPVDPYDAMKGRYIDLRFKETQGTIENGVRFSYGQTAYAVIAKDQDGKARITKIVDRLPQGPYIKVKISYITGNKATIKLPFRRFYLREDLAPAAESAYRAAADKEGLALIRIKDGYGVVEQLYIGKKTIFEILQENAIRK